MDNYILILLVIGSLLLFVTLGSGWISRLPLSYALIYLIIGIILGPYGIQLIKIRPDADFLERLTEFVVIVSLFSCGLKMNRPLNALAWNSTIRLIGFLMPISIFALAFLDQWLLGLEFGTAVLLGAILAPTDPVLASEVQIKHPEDGDELRFGLTSEGGLNDALAFPFVYFGLYWLKDSNWQNWFKDWVLVDLIWASAAGMIMGILVAKAVVWLDQRLHLSNIDSLDELMEDFIALSIIFLTYSLTELVNGYGFLAVFVAGIVTQRSYRTPEKPHNQLEFIERLEKLLEVGTILLLGSILRFEPILFYLSQSLMIAGLLFFVIRPLGAWISTIGDRFVLRRFLFGWFGIRGVGSLYYLFYAFGKGLKGELGEQIAWITLTTIALSVIIHGITTTPIMNWYERQMEKRQAKLAPYIKIK
ncbi:sodium:proton antiporter [Aphanothece hegewaldii CCALA 016]|uniref:Sodium:proton antiporter n=1 Tax=Aphanothece hegewaldii CCALA 016 TaxID=2107694 RepID=A0A2T1M2C0_9CHRO|nr:sodium:proton antiporter [Aphanothece hegewaldii]PSF38901.1 sodium:proton antiporter [Aphanothece hegewaldii CCALA 016]